MNDLSAGTEEVSRMFVESSAYDEGTMIPPRFATRFVAGGTGASVPLRWEDEPAATRSYAITMIDHHPVANDWLHWLVIDIPSGAHELPEGASRTGAMPAGALELGNTGGRAGYGGPQPPAGSGPHDYEVTVFALDVPRLGVHADASLEDVRAAMQGHVLDQATLTGRFEQ
jgi:Raf kinase inhibitor-like YbhB/YbcL family protein